MIDYPKYLEDLILEFSKLPGIGYKTAVRLSMHVINKSEEDVMKFSYIVKNSKLKLKYCIKCGNFSDENLCLICMDNTRDKKIVCVVQEVKDVHVFEKIKSYNGIYHVLHGAISPLKGIGPDTLKINELLERIKNENIEEVILATNPTLEGEATCVYISKFIEKNIKVTRLAHGVPLGSDLEHVDEMTLSRALDFRQNF